ncbi:MAG: hypothetical protein IPI53_14280 [Saprospiraceae bacterium]|nr:hypothetical protein [Saprospiraceae bacterium]
MKPYRILSNEELEILKPEFLKYLVSQGIPAEEWEKWKIADIEKTKLMIESFSEFIYFSILQKTRYVHKVVDQGRQFIRCNDNEFDLIWIQYQESYNDKEDLLSESNREKFEIVKGKKKCIQCQKMMKFSVYFYKAFDWCCKKMKILRINSLEFFTSEMSFHKRSIQLI